MVIIFLVIVGEEVGVHYILPFPSDQRQQLLFPQARPVMCNQVGVYHRHITLLHMIYIYIYIYDSRHALMQAGLSGVQQRLEGGDNSVVFNHTGISFFYKLKESC